MGTYVTGRFEGRYDGSLVERHPSGHLERFVVELQEAAIVGAHLTQGSRPDSTPAPQLRIERIANVRISLGPPAPDGLPYLEDVTDVTISNVSVEDVWRDGKVVYGRLAGVVTACLLPTTSRLTSAPDVAPSPAAGGVGTASDGPSADDMIAGTLVSRERIIASPRPMHTWWRTLESRSCLTIATLTLWIGVLALAAMAFLPPMLRWQVALGAALGVTVVALVSGATRIVLGHDGYREMLHSSMGQFFRASLAWIVLASTAWQWPSMIGVGLLALASYGWWLLREPRGATAARTHRAVTTRWSALSARVPGSQELAERVVAVSPVAVAAGAAAMIAGAAATYALGLHHYALTLIGILPFALIIVPIVGIIAVGLAGGWGAFVTLCAIVAVFVLPAELQGTPRGVLSAFGAAMVSGLIALLATDSVAQRPRLHRFLHLAASASVALPIVVLGVWRILKSP